MARKNKMEGAVPGAGRKPKPEKTNKVAFYLSDEAIEVLKTVPRMEKSQFVSQAIVDKSGKLPDHENIRGKDYYK